jgi:hypothetical protein
LGFAYRGRGGYRRGPLFFLFFVFPFYKGVALSGSLRV